ncbi:alpha/beta fold hydrolase [Streptomyces albidoflavus]
MAPRTPRERAVAELWEEALGIGGIGIHDNFFDLGGDSMRAVLLVGRLRQKDVLDVPAASLLAAPTVAGLLAAGEPAEDAVAGPGALAPLLPLRPDGGRRPLFCVHPGAGVSWRYSGLLPHLGADQPVFGLQAAGLDGARQPARDAREMVEGYLDLLRTVQPSGPYRLLGWSYGGFVAHAMACALQERGEEVELLALLDAPLPHGSAHDPKTAERQVAGLLSRVAGLEVGADGPPGVEDVLDRVGAAHAAGSSPVSRDEAASIAAVMRNNLRIAPEFTPGVFRGDALFFSATRDLVPAADAGDLSLAAGKADACPVRAGCLRGPRRALRPLRHDRTRPDRPHRRGLSPRPCARPPADPLPRIRPARPAPEGLPVTMTKDLYELGDAPPLGTAPKQMYASLIRQERYGRPSTPSAPKWWTFRPWAPDRCSSR